MLIKILLLILLLPAFCLAAIYQYTDPQGNIVYSNKYKPGAEKVDLPVIGSFKKIGNNKNELKKLLAEPEKKPVKKPVKHVYQEFAISAPAEHETFNNQRLIIVSFNIKPELQKGDKIKIYVNGNLVKIAKEAIIDLENLDRGEHELSAELVDESGKLLMRCKAITIYVRYSSLYQLVRKVRPVNSIEINPTPIPINPVPSPLHKP